MSIDKEGLYAIWEWNHARECWEYHVPHRIYPMEDGYYVVSRGDVYIACDPNSFEQAEAVALGISQEQYDRDKATVAAIRSDRSLTNN